MNILKKLFDHEYKEMKRFKKLADAVMALEEDYAKLSDDELKSHTTQYKERLKNGESLDDLLVEAYATAREVAYRKLGEKAFYVQILGAIAIHFGNIAELKTG